MGCRFCWGERDEGALSHGLLSSAALTTEEVKQLACQARDMGSREILFGGGDPGTRKDIGELVEYADDEGLRVALDTNGWVFAHREELFKGIAPHLHQLGLALDGPDADTHDTFRGKRGAFEGVMKLIRLSEQRSYRLKINTVVTKENYENILRMVDTLSPFKNLIARWSIGQFLATGIGAKNADRYRITDKQYIEMADQIRDEAGKRLPHTTLGIDLASEKGTTVFMITSQGIVYTMNGSEKVYIPGSIRTRPLFELVEDAARIKLDLTKMNGERYATEYYQS